MLYYSIYALAAGFILDLIIGDPRWLYHPVCVIGNLIALLEKILRKIFPKTDKGELVAGTVEVILVCLFSGGIPFLILHFLYGISAWAGLALETFWCYQLLATKSLKTESMKVYDRLKNGTLDEARYAVSMIVGRDTKVLDKAGITRAAVETVAENTSDGVIAPFLFMAVFGPLGGTFYKAVNTMDSMIGYRNDKYILFGRTAAKLDDVLNFIPARISGCLLTLAAYLLPGADGKNAWRIFLRDRRKHDSPNSAHGEAACAGALHLRLAGDAWYFGVLHKKQFIGDNDREIVPEDIWKASLLMFLAEGILMAVLLVILAAVRL